MFAFSVLSGRLSDKWGRGPVIWLGRPRFCWRVLPRPYAPNVFPLAVSLFLLGLGWNFCFVGGSALLVDQLSPLNVQDPGCQRFAGWIGIGGGQFGKRYRVRCLQLYSDRDSRPARWH